jgi:hypothetical protein
MSSPYRYEMSRMGWSAVLPPLTTLEGGFEARGAHQAQGDELWAHAGARHLALRCRLRNSDMLIAIIAGSAIQDDAWEQLKQDM